MLRISYIKPAVHSLNDLPPLASRNRTGIIVQTMPDGGVNFRRRIISPVGSIVNPLGVKGRMTSESASGQSGKGTY